MKNPGKIHFKFRDLFEVTGEGALGVFVVAGLALLIMSPFAIGAYMYLN
ncbi:hypothetical protein [Shinella sp.]